MHKHRLYTKDSCSPLSSGEMGKLTPKNQPIHPALAGNQSNSADKPVLGKRRSFRNTPIAEKNNKRSKNSPEQDSTTDPKVNGKKISKAQDKNFSNHQISKQNKNPSAQSTQKTLTMNMKDKESVPQKFVTPASPQTISHEKDTSPVSRIESPEIQNKNSILDLNSSFDNDVFDPDFTILHCSKIPYTFKEDEVIVNYVLKGQNIFKVSSISLWKHLESKKVDPKRTFHSLKNRFLRNIKPHLFTTYKHLIKDKETVNKILSKYPELKKQMGNKNALPIQPPPLSKSPSNIPLQSSSPNNNSSGKISVPVSESVVKLVNFNRFNNVSYLKELECKDTSISVTVYFNKEVIKRTNFQFLKLGEKFGQLIKNNERIQCSACGRYNNQYKDSPDSESDSQTDSDIFIPNSLQSQKADQNTSEVISELSVRNSESVKSTDENNSQEAVRDLIQENTQNDLSDRVRKNSGSKSSKNKNSVKEINNSHDVTVEKPASKKRESKNLQKKSNDSAKSNRNHSQNSRISLCNLECQRLISYDTSADESEEPSVDLDEPISENLGSPSSVNSYKETEKAGNSTESGLDSTSEKTLLSSEKSPGKTTRSCVKDISSNIEGVLVDMSAKFRQIISADEEKMVSRRCLFNNRDAIGFSSNIDLNLESYFLESSPDFQTPSLTNSSSALQENCSYKLGFESSSNSSLASNMKKMLEPKK